MDPETDTSTCEEPGPAVVVFYVHDGEYFPVTNPEGWPDQAGAPDPHWRAWYAGGWWPPGGAAPFDDPPPVTTLNG